MASANAVVWDGILQIKLLFYGIYKTHVPVTAQQMLSIRLLDSFRLNFSHAV